MEPITTKATARSNKGYQWVRLIAALLLLTTATLKGYDLSTKLVVGGGLFDFRWAMIGVVEMEFLLSLWLLAGIWPRPTWAATLACFSLFTCVSLCKAISGHASCGCFGRVPVNPWYTGTLDFMVICLLLRWRPKESLFTIGRAIAVLMIWIAVGVPAAYAMVSYTPGTLADSGKVVGDGKVVVLKPETWIGKTFPLLNYTSITEEINRGKWLILLYRAECPKCQKIMRLPHLVRALNVEQIALIEMPPYGNPNDLLRSVGLTVVYGFLDNSEEWVVETPHAILLNEGVVLDAWQGVVRSDHVAYNKPITFGLRSFRVE